MGGVVGEFRWQQASQAARLAKLFLSFFLFFLPFGLLRLFLRTLCWQGCISVPLLVSRF